MSEQPDKARCTYKPHAFDTRNHPLNQPTPSKTIIDGLTKYRDCLRNSRDTEKEFKVDGLFAATASNHPPISVEELEKVKDRLPVKPKDYLIKIVASRSIMQELKSRTQPPMREDLKRINAMFVGVPITTDTRLAPDRYELHFEDGSIENHSTDPLIEMFLRSRQNAFGK